MKNINLNQLRIVIREAMAGEGEEQPGEEAAQAGPDAAALDSSAGGKEQSDVGRVLSYIGKIDNRKEYAQLLMSLVQHGQNVPGAKGILVKLYKQLPAMAKQMAESKINEDDVQTQPGMEQGGGEPGPEDDIKNAIDMLQGEEDPIGTLYNVIRRLEIALEKLSPAPIGFRENLRQALIKESFKRTLKNATKK